MHTYKYAKTLFEAYTDLEHETKDKDEIYNLQNTHLQQVLETCLKEMRSLYKPRRELFREDALYGKCNRSRSFRASMPEKNIGNVGMFMECQTAEFRQYYELFTEAVGYLRKNVETERVDRGLKSILKSTLYKELGEDGDKLNLRFEKNRGLNTAVDLYFEEYFTTYAGIKLTDCFLIGSEKKYDIDSLCGYMYSNFRKTAETAYLATFYTGGLGEKLMDSQAHPIFTLRYVLGEREKETGEKFRIEHATDKQLEDIRQRYNRTQSQEAHQIAKIDRVKELLEFAPTKLYELSPARTQTLSLDSPEDGRLLDKYEFESFMQTEEKEANEALLEVVNELKKTLCKKTFECMNDTEKYIIVRRCALLSMGYTEEVATKTAQEEIGSKKDPMVILGRAMKEGSPYRTYVKETRTSEDFEDILYDADTELEAFEVLAKASSEMLRDSYLMAEVSGLDMDTIYHGVGVEERGFEYGD